MHVGDCEKWFEIYIKLHGPITPAAVYEAGKKIGFSRKEIRAARRRYDGMIITEINGEKTTWQWRWL